MRTKRGQYIPRHPNLEDRLNRAKSWFDAASRLEKENPGHAQIQVAFIYRVIAFNALYGRRQHESRIQLGIDLRDFFDKVITLHKEDRHVGGSILPDALQKSRASWEHVIEDEFVYNWYYKHRSLDSGFWSWYTKRRFKACIEWSVTEYRDLLLETFQRILVLRTLIFHGCAMFGPESKGWESIETATPVLRALLPAFHQLMLQYGDRIEWPKSPYPRQYSDEHPQRRRGDHPSASKPSGVMKFFLAFGTDMGKPGLKQGVWLSMEPMLVDWNRTLAVNGYPIKFLGTYRHTRNFLLQAPEGTGLQKVARALAALPLFPASAVFEYEGFVVFLQSAAYALRQPPRIISGRRGTPGIVMARDLKAGIPPTPASDERAVFGKFAVPRIRIAWKVDGLSAAGKTLDQTHSEEGWGALSNRMNQVAGGIWTARAMSSVEQIVQAAGPFFR